MGIKYLFRKDRWELSLAYFHNADLSGVGGDSELSASRYAYDIAGRDKEAHQGNVRPRIISNPVETPTRRFGPYGRFV